MIYYEKPPIRIRTLASSDVQIFTEEERRQGYHSEAAKFEMRLKDQAEHRAIALAAEYEGNPAGYINVYFRPAGGPFAGQELPELVDFGVLEKYRNRGIGTALLDTAEKIASELADTVCLGVGLHNGYGSAQRLYVKRGYIPDGSGVWYQDQVCAQYAPCCNDDDLILYFSKKLR